MRVVRHLIEYSAVMAVRALVAVLPAGGVRALGTGLGWLFYTGDVNFEDQTLMRGARFPTERVDVLVMETTRGDSPVAEGFIRAREEVRFIEALQARLLDGGDVDEHV